MKALNVWIKKIKFTHTVYAEKEKPMEFVQEIMCLIWKPEFYEPKLTGK